MTEYFRDGDSSLCSVKTRQKSIRKNIPYGLNMQINSVRLFGLRLVTLVMC